MSHSSNNKPNIDAIVLAGGQARRMQSMDKGLILFQQKPLIAHVLARVAPQVDRTVISANRNLDDYRRFGCDVIQDLRPDFQGPLAGIEACAALCNAEFTLIVSCDTPLLPADLAQTLMMTLNTESCPATFVDDGERQHYLCALVKTPVLATVSDYLDNDQRSVRGWLRRLGAKPTLFAGTTNAFRNINDTDDIGEA